MPLHVKLIHFLKGKVKRLSKQSTPLGGKGSYIPVEIFKARITIEQSQTIYNVDGSKPFELLTHPELLSNTCFFQVRLLVEQCHAEIQIQTTETSIS